MEPICPHSAHPGRKNPSGLRAPGLSRSKAQNKNWEEETLRSQATRSLRARPGAGSPRPSPAPGRGRPPERNRAGRRAPRPGRRAPRPARAYSFIPPPPRPPPPAGGPRQLPRLGGCPPSGAGPGRGHRSLPRSSCAPLVPGAHPASQLSPLFSTQSCYRPRKPWDCGTEAPVLGCAAFKGLPSPHPSTPDS